MRKLFLILLIAILGALVLFYFRAEKDNTPPPTTPSLPLKQETPLSLEEAVGQLFIIGFRGTEMTKELRSLLETFRPGGVLLLGRNVKDAKQLQQLTNDLQSVVRAKNSLPLFVAVDQEGEGVLRVFWTKERTPESKLKDSAHARAVGKARAEELKNLGVNMNLAPVFDSRNKGDALFFRSFQKNDVKAEQLAIGLIQGHEDESVIPVVKHFPGYDGISFNPEMTVIPRIRTTPDTTLFRNVSYKTQSPFVMVSHVIYEDRDARFPFPFSQSGSVLLRSELGNDILIMSDDLLSAAFQKVYSLEDLARLSIESDLDILLAGDPTLAPKLMQSMLHIMRNDQALQERIYTRAKKVIQLKKDFFNYEEKK